MCLPRKSGNLSEHILAFEPQKPHIAHAARISFFIVIPDGQGDKVSALDNREPASMIGYLKN